MAVLMRPIHVNDAVVSAELGDEAVLLNVETGLYFGLGEEELLVWNLLSEGATIEEIVRRFLDEFDVEEAQIRADLSSFIEKLIERELVRVQS